MNRSRFPIAALAALFGCTSNTAATNGTTAAPPSPAPAAAAPAANTEHGIDLGGIDHAIAPGDDFFAYANGAWLKATEIPPDRAMVGTMSVMDDVTSHRTADLIQSASQEQDPALVSDAKKIADYYASYMDEAGIEAKGLGPVKPQLEKVAAINDAKELARYIGTTLRADVDVLNDTTLHTSNLFGVWIAQDLDDPTHYSVFLLQGGLGLPDRDYYTDPGKRMADIRAKYQIHIANALKLTGVAEADAQARAQRIFALEQQIAQVHARRADSEDVEKGNNHWTRAELDTRAPGLDWAALLAGARLESQKGFVVWHPNALIGISALAKSQPLSTWKEYLAFRALEEHAGLLPKAFADESFDFYGRTLIGTQQQRDRWRRGVAVTDGALGMAVGKLYVAKYFPPSEKARAELLVKNEIAAFAKRIEALDWMAPETKAKAKAKLAVLKVGVGYPDKWRDYSKLEVVRGEAYANAMRASLFEYQRNLDKLGAPVDRGEWVMNPQLVNAVNLPAMNALNFPAAILQPPDFDPTRPMAMDYGSEGATIGHEISHSFDDQGALFDETGRVKNWWTKEDFAHFHASSEALVKQFDAYHPFPDLAENGRQTISENIADVAGLSAAFDAYRLSLDGKEAPLYQGLTGDQQFFLSFAQSWRAKGREAAIRQRVIVDGHALPEYRADTVRNLDAWYPAFDVKPGQKLYLAPAERVRMW